MAVDGCGWVCGGSRLLWVALERGVESGGTAELGWSLSGIRLFYLMAVAVVVKFLARAEYHAIVVIALRTPFAANALLLCEGWP